MRPDRKRELVGGMLADWGVSIRRACKVLPFDTDLPRDFHPALIRAAAVVVMPFGALFAMGSGMPDPIAKIV